MQPSRERVQMRTYDIFLSHSWRYYQQYKALLHLLHSHPYFYFRDYSIPPHKKIAGPYSWVWHRIDEQIRQSSVVIFPAGIYATYSPSIQKEINIAKKYHKPIIAVIPWGASRASFLTIQADKTVGWNAGRIVNAVRELC